LEEPLKEQNFLFCKIDVCHREAVYNLFEEEHPDIVVNFAAESDVTVLSKIQKYF
jgi:dTDP-D-glucose 4,6-dehydratase